MSGSRAWSFVFYTCGHRDPVRGGDRKVDRPCAACAARREAQRDIEARILAFELPE